MCDACTWLPAACHASLVHAAGRVRAASPHAVAGLLWPHRSAHPPEPRVSASKNYTLSVRSHKIPPQRHLSTMAEPKYGGAYISTMEEATDPKPKVDEKCHVGCVDAWAKYEACSERIDEKVRTPRAIRRRAAALLLTARHLLPAVVATMQAPQLSTTRASLPHTRLARHAAGEGRVLGLLHGLLQVH